MTCKVIGLAGPARSGKDTAAREIRYLVNSSDQCDCLTVDTDSFAAPIREMVAGMLKVDLLTLEDIKDDVVPWIGKSPRVMMQTLGTEWGRDTISKTLWLDRIVEKHRDLSSGRQYGGDYLLLIPDVRFENEAEWVRKVGTLAHVQRDRAEAVAAHPSEYGIAYQEGDVIIPNNMYLSDLRRELERLLL
jgi:hypothetical protein